MDKIPPWGTYSPNLKASYLRFLTATGVVRGNVTKKVALLWKRLHGNLVDIQIRRIKYRMDLSNNTTDTKVLCSSKEYDGKELSALKNSCKNGVFVDAGANVGYYSLALAKSGAARVLAIEPNPPTLARLLFHIQINQFNNLITAIPTGIGPEGESTFFSTGDLGSASLIEDKSLQSRAITIQTRPLLDLIREHGIDKIDGLKIDVEGMEDRALLPFFEKAPTSLWPSCLVIEHCHHKEWDVDIISYLLKNGYRQTDQTRANTIFKLKNK